MHESRSWTIYIAQDKHLDYNWCGTRTDIEVRMSALIDGYLTLAEQGRSRWNLDSTWWYDVYFRHRGPAGAKRLQDQLQRGTIGCAANLGVLQWGLLNTELSILAFINSLELAEMVGRPIKTALIEENPGMPWSVASAVTACGIPFLGRGIYDLRARSYNRNRQPYPLFNWQAPDGKTVLVHWDLYDDNFSWGGYSEAFKLAKIAGEDWDALSVQEIGDRNTDEIYAQRVDFIHQTVARYREYGEDYPVSSILLLGTGWDNWTITDDYAQFIRRFNAESDGSILLVDALYQDYFTAVKEEINQKSLSIPTLTGSFGITWEEWAAHLAGPTRDFRQASRLLVHAQAQYALDWLSGQAGEKTKIALDQGIDACFRFAEHDFAGVDRKTAAISAGVRAGAVMEANTLFRSLSSVDEIKAAVLTGDIHHERYHFMWQDWRVHFDPSRCAVTSLLDLGGKEWIPQQGDLALGSFWHTLHREDQLPDTVLPDSLQHQENAEQEYAICRRGENGIEIKTSGKRWGFGIETRWFFHNTHPWIDIFYDLSQGWTEAAQSVQFCFPFTLPDPKYTYDMASTILQAGSVEAGGDDLPGANPVLYALQNFAQVTSIDGNSALSVILLSPDAPLVQFGSAVYRVGGANLGDVPAAIISMPMMNLTRNDWQFNQGGMNRWQFRYRIIMSQVKSNENALDLLLPMRQSQYFAVPPFLQMPGDPPVIVGLADLHIHFDGGPVTALKRSEDGERLIIRVWNVLDHPVTGTAKLPTGFKCAEVNDALERHLYATKIKEGITHYTVPGKSMLTLAFASDQAS